MRCFVGIAFSEECVLKIKKLAQNLIIAGFRGNFTSNYNLHLTLAFLGEIEASDIEKVKSVLIGLEERQFNILITKLKPLKDMMILEVESSKLIDCQNRLALALKNKKIKYDEKNFYPHITLIRKTNKFLEMPLNIESKIKRISLFSSRRIDGKIIYQEEYYKELDE